MRLPLLWRELDLAMHLTNLPGRCEIKVIETCYADDCDAVTWHCVMVDVTGVYTPYCEDLVHVNPSRSTIMFDCFR